MITILLPVHERVAVTKKFINCLIKQTLKDFRLILIDDGSTDGTTEMVLQNILATVVIKGKGDWWWGGSLQQGYLRLKNQKKIDAQDVVLIINDDTEFEPDFLEKGCGILKNNQRTLLLAQAKSLQTSNTSDTGTMIDWKKFEFRNARQGENIDCLSTRGLFVHATDFLDIGGFRPVLLPHYLSDYEFTIRAKAKGFKLMTDQSVWLCVDESTTGIHDKTASIKKILSKKSAINPFYLLIFIMLSCPWKHKLSAVYHGIMKKIIRSVFCLGK